MTSGHLHFVIPGDIDTPTGGYGYDRQVIAGLRALGWTIDVVSLSGSYPDTDTQTRAAADVAFTALPDGALVLVDGLAFARLPALMARHSRRLRIAALVHHPLADEGGLPDPVALRFAADEIEALRHAATVICTSVTTGRRLVDRFEVAQTKLHVAQPGALRKSLLTTSRQRNCLLCVASIVPRKGHDVLIDALAQLHDLEWSARFVGPSRDRHWQDTLDAMIAAHDLSERIVFTGALSHLDAEYERAGIFVLATRHEGYGMAYAEALSAGLPVIGCAVGAVPEVVPPSAGALVAADDPDAFATALRRLLSDEFAYEQAARGAGEAARSLPCWNDTVATIARVLKEIDR